MCDGLRDVGAGRCTCVELFDNSTSMAFDWEGGYLSQCVSGLCSQFFRIFGCGTVGDVCAHQLYYLNRSLPALSIK